MAWELNYIEDAATAREVIYHRDGTVACASSSNYDPPANGIHLCGQTDDGMQPTTVATYSMRSTAARELFLAARNVAECARGEHDFVVDLCIDGSIDDDFFSNRQLWPRAIAAWNAS